MPHLPEEVVLVVRNVCSAFIVLTLALAIANAVVAISSRFNYVQYLTIRRYLSLVFGALVLLLLGMVLWR